MFQAFEPTQLKKKKKLPLLLAFFPESLHTAMLANFFTPGKTFRGPLTSSSCPALRALRSLPQCAPPLLSLRIDGGRSGWEEKLVVHEVWSWVTQVFHRHSGLTSLQFSAPGFAAISNEVIVPEISKLMSLQSLDLRGCVVCLEESASTLTAAL